MTTELRTAAVAVWLTMLMLCARRPTLIGGVDDVALRTCLGVQPRW